MDMKIARQQMVEQQVRAWDVLDEAVLGILMDLPREQFVPSEFESMAFADTELPIGHEQSMMTPIVEGRLLQSLALRKTDNVLEIGTGTGFLTACLARLANSVTSIDIHDDFLQSAAVKLQDTGIANVELALMDATQQLPDGQFDAIAVTASMPTLDLRYVSALKPGGRLFVVVGESPVMDALLIRPDSSKEWSAESVFETELAPNINCPPPVRFLF
jgi:protein-L-isoaspartate(D-aspartate) O-methyltransferase